MNDHKFKLNQLVSVRIPGKGVVSGNITLVGKTAIGNTYSISDLDGFGPISLVRERFISELVVRPDNQEFKFKLNQDVIDGKGNRYLVIEQNRRLGGDYYKIRSYNTGVDTSISERDLEKLTKRVTRNEPLYKEGRLVDINIKNRKRKLSGTITKIHKLGDKIAYEITIAQVGRAGIAKINVNEEEIKVSRAFYGSIEIFVSSL